MSLINGNWSFGIIPLLIYKKGAIIVNMLNDVIGRFKMRNVFRIYLQENQWKSANTTNFLRILDKTVPVSIRNN